MTWVMTTFRRMTLYKQPDLLPLDQAVYSAGRKPGFFNSRMFQRLLAREIRPLPSSHGTNECIDCGGALARGGGGMNALPQFRDRLLQARHRIDPRENK